MNTFVFDIETIPDTNLGRQLYHLKDLSDEAVIQAMTCISKQTRGSDFLKLHLHQIVTISVVLRTPTQFNVWSLGTETSSEKELLERFFDGLQKYLPTLVSWNGGGFDLPVIHYRSLIHGISAPSYWETGDEDASFRWNNYLNRFHYRHTDLMDVLAGYQNRANASLDEIALSLGFPGKMGLSGKQVWQTFLQQDIASIRNYCETDVLNTYLIYLRFELLRGRLSLLEYEKECAHVREFLLQTQKPHWLTFCEHWKN
jgi:predicted PolB exonuclease-like 3'-5' exonuclease